jgi:predicted phosphodiesterase
MRSFFRFLFQKPVLWLVNRYSSAPDRTRVFDALSKLKKTMENDPGKKGFSIPFNLETHRFIIFSDQHKGRKNGADDFMMAEKNYLIALRYYNEQNFHLISLGDCEELWENTVLQVMNHNHSSFEEEKKFVSRSAFTKIVGNHDLDWEIDPLAPAYLKKIYGVPMVVLEGVMLETAIGNETLKILCTHGHQGDLQSDGNWFSKFFVTKIWGPFQAFLRINPNTPAFDRQLKTAHNRVMYEWSSQQKNLILITGHTHQPVFESLTHFERLQWQHRKALYEHNPEWAQALEDEMSWRRTEDTQIAWDYLNIRPVYFNSGCCCFADGDITGIEIADGFIRLIKWEETDKATNRLVLQEKRLEDLIRDMN